jgi:hypothetical protein
MLEDVILVSFSYRFLEDYGLEIFEKATLGDDYDPSMDNKYLAQDFGSSYDKNARRDGLALKILSALPLGEKL